MALVLEIELLAGFCAAATGPDNETPEWPLEPDRVFSALVASWGARGCHEDEAEALRWLERQPAPKVLASPAEARSTPVVYVPPNDARLDRAKKAVEVLPALRKRQPRRFAVARPEEPVQELAWTDEPPPETLAALDRLARDTAYLGASRSLVRCRFRTGAPGLAAAARVPGRWVYPGRLAELEGRFHQGRRPLPGPIVLRAPHAETHRPAGTAFASEWLVLEHVDGAMPDLRACALVARAIRECLLAGYGRLGLGHAIPEELSGHDEAGAPSRRPHLAIVPLPFVGFPFADGHVMGFALVPPAGSRLLEEDGFRRALRGLAPFDPQLGRRRLEVATARGTQASAAFKVGLALGGVGLARRSLDPALYRAPARRFATVTPVVLDRHLKERGAEREEEIAGLVAAACERAGVPRPVRVVADRHGVFEGTPSVAVRGEPAWARWRLPAPLASRQLVHAVIEFARPIAGPVLLGAGRFFGLGLCRPLP